MQSIKAVLWKSLRICRAHWKPLLVTAALLELPISLMLVATDLLSDAEGTRFGGSSRSLLAAGQVAVYIVGAAVCFFTAAALTVAIEAALDGRKPSWRAAWQGGLDRAWPVVSSMLALLPRLIGWFIVSLVIAAPFRWLISEDGSATLALVTVSVLTWRYSLLVGAAVIEGRIGADAIDRSIDLVRGRFGLVVATTLPLTIVETLFMSGFREGSAWMDLVRLTVGWLLAPLACAIVVVLFRTLRLEKDGPRAAEPTNDSVTTA